jgi:hypothetical protein
MKTNSILTATIKTLGPVVRFFIIVNLGLQAVPECQAQSSAPYIPPSDNVHIKPQTNSQPVSVMVSVTLPSPSPCYSVSNWGQPLLLGNSVSVDAQFWSSNAVCPTVLSDVSTQYNLGSLPPGDYRFVFGAWGVTVKTQAFSVPVFLSIGTLQAASQIPLCWNTATSAWYRLEYSSILATNKWAPLTTWFPGSGSRFCTNDAILAGQPQKFYRVAGTNAPPP